MAIDWPMVFLGVKTVLEPLAAASWPIAIGLIAWLFKEPIKELAERVQNLSVPGATAQFGAQEQLEHQRDAEKAIVPQISRSLVNASDPPSDPTFDYLDNELRAFLNERVSGDDSQKLKWAIRARSISESTRIHETNYRLIFGSQIFALKMLNEAGQKEISTFRDFYTNQVVKDARWGDLHQNRSFEMWGQFLLDAQYVVEIEGIDPPSVAITPLGKQFLQWMAITGASESKIG